MYIKKQLSALLSAALVLGTMSFSAFAESTVVTVNTTEEFQTTLNNAADGTTIQLTSGVNYGTVSVPDVANITILGASGAKVDAIRFSDKVNNVVIDGVEFTGKNDSTSLLDSSIFVNLQTNDLNGLTVRNCKLNDADEKNSILVYIYGGDGNSTTTAANNITITGNTVENVQKLARLNSKSVQIANVTITDNTIKNTDTSGDGHGMLLEGAHYSGNIVITDNTADNIHERFLRLSGAGDSKVNISNNKVTNYKGADPDFVKISECNSEGNITFAGNKIEGKSTISKFNAGTYKAYEANEALYVARNNNIENEKDETSHIATGFKADADASKIDSGTAISKFIWNVTSEGVTKTFTFDSKDADVPTIMGGGSVEVGLVVVGLYDKNATVELEIQ